MVEFKLLATLLLLLFPLITTANSNCGKCGSQSSVACLSATEFYFCPSGKVDPTTVHVCPHGTTCTDSPTVCEEYPERMGCECSSCSGSMKFSCLNATAYVLCGAEDDRIVGECASGMFCDVRSESFCSKTPSCYLPDVREGHGYEL